MAEQRSFWSRYRDLDAASHPEVLLDVLDRYAAMGPMQELKRAATDRLDLQPGDRVLDAGCGTGVDLLDMLERVRPGGTVIGIDVSARAVAAAAGRHADVEGLSALVADITRLPFDKSTFDAIRTDRTLQHLDRPDSALVEFHRVLQAGGRLVVLEVASELQAADGTDAHSAVRAVADHWASAEERRGWLPLMLPLLLARAGFTKVGVNVVEVHSTEPDVIAMLLAIRQSGTEAVTAVGDGHESVEDAFARLHEASTTGELTLTMRGVCVTAQAG